MEPRKVPAVDGPDWALGVVVQTAGMGPSGQALERAREKERISNGAVEGMNNKAEDILNYFKVVSHRCYGFRTAKNYITALYHCLGNLPEPKLVHGFF